MMDARCKPKHTGLPISYPNLIEKKLNHSSFPIYYIPGNSIADIIIDADNRFEQTLRNQS